MVHGAVNATTFRFSLRHAQYIATNHATIYVIYSGTLVSLICNVQFIHLLAVFKIHEHMYTCHEHVYIHTLIGKD